MDFLSFGYSFALLSLLITKRIFPMYKKKIPMALATITFPTTIFFKVKVKCLEKRNSILLDIKNIVNKKVVNG
jgi:hypothetical protein